MEEKLETKLNINDVDWETQKSLAQLQTLLINKAIVEPLVKRQKELINKRIKCERYSRVVGYLRPVEQWNEGKQSEFKDRVTFKIELEGGK